MTSSAPGPVPAEEVCGGTAWHKLARGAARIRAGLPYLWKEIERGISMRTGQVLTTPMSYFVVFGGRCNLACTFCTIYSEPEPSLSGDTLIRLMHEIRALSGSGFNISLSGGEPTVYPPLYDLLELTHRLGIDFGFTTNGLALNRSTVNRVLQCDPFNINVSLESVDPRINESLRPAHQGTRRALAGIDHLVEEKTRIGARVSIIVKPTIMEQNYRGLPTLVRHFGRRGPVQIMLQPFTGPGSDPHWVQDASLLVPVIDELIALQEDGYPVIGDRSLLHGFLDYFRDRPHAADDRRLDLRGRKRNCDIGLRSMFIYPNGDVFLCDYAGRSIGNVHLGSLAEMYHGAAARREREMMVWCDRDCQLSCNREIPLSVKVKSFLRMG